MKQLDLTTFERMTLAQWVNQQKGDLRKIRQLIKLLDKLELSEQEKRAVGWVQVENQMMWKDKERTFDLEFEDDQFDLLLPALEGKWPADRVVLAMLEKLEEANR